MTTFPGSPRLIKGGIVLIDSGTSAVRRVIVLQYSPDTISRTLQVQGVGESGDRSEALRLKGAPVETIKLEAEIDATDQLEFPDQNRTATQFGIFPQLAALETLIYPTSAQLNNNNRLAQAGTLEIVPMETPLALFVWSKTRILPVRVTELSVTEEAFDPNLNPIRAKVSLGLRVLSVNDLGFDHKGGGLFMNYLQQKENFVQINSGILSALGITGIP
ncbi:MAG TPA: hypothetical protein VF644_08475 [Pyrinomonadaceae bacterium]|jgi:hypothetical protein